MPDSNHLPLDLAPTFFILGAAKCGTTSLHSYLQSHHEISMSRLKEPNYFAGPHPQFESSLRWGQVDSPTEYSSLFDPNCSVRGEASTVYAEYPFFAGVIDRIHAVCPEAKFIYLVRDPIERLRAHYMQRVAAGAPAGFADLVEDGDPANELVCASRYMTQIDQLSTRFPSDRALVIEQADLRQEPDRQLSLIFQFLHVEPVRSGLSRTTELNRSADKTHVVPWVRRFARSRPAAAVIGRLPRRSQRAIRGLGLRTMSRPVTAPTISPQLQERFEDLFTPEVERLREFTGQDFASWSL